MGFTNFNLSDFSFFTGERLTSEKKLLRQKVYELGMAVYDNLPYEIKQFLDLPRVGRIYEFSKSIWFSFPVKISNSNTASINYNFDLTEDGIRYCLNSETDLSRELFKDSVNNNVARFLYLVNNIIDNKIWLYNRKLKYGPSGSFLIGKQTWEKIKLYKRPISAQDNNSLLTKINNLKHSAVRIGSFYSKDRPLVTGPYLPNFLVQMTKDYFELFKFLNDLH